MQMWEVVELEKKESWEDGRREGKKEGKKEGVKEGIKEGKKQGIKEGKVASIIEILEELGMVSEELKQMIALQKDENTINKWLKLAARATSIGDFVEKMNI